MKTRHIYYIPLALLFVVAVTFQTRFTMDAVRQLFWRSEMARPPLSTQHEIHTQRADQSINYISPEAIEAGVHKGDLLVSVNGEPYTGSAILQGTIARAHPGDPITFTIRHPETEGQTREETITLKLAPLDYRQNFVSVLIFVVMFLVMPIFCLLLGFWVTVLRPRDPLAWLLLALMLSFSQLIPRTNMAGWEWWLRGLAVLYHTFFFSSWPLWMFLFGLYFPGRLVYDRRFPWAKWVLIVPLTISILTDLVTELGSVENFAAVAPLIRLFKPFDSIFTVVQMVAIGFFFAGLGIQHGMATTPDAKRRLKLMRVGTTISMMPMFILVLYSIYRGVANPFANISVWVAAPTLLLLFVFPLTLAYVIVVHRAMDVRVVLRQGVQYAFARNGVRVLQVILSAIIIYAAATLSLQPDTNRPQKITAIAIGIAFVFLIGRVSERLRAWTDRRFFREAYNAEQILSDLGEKVRTMVETAPLLKMVSQSISESLHVPRVAMLLKEGSAYRPAHFLGYEQTPPVSFNEEAATVEKLKGENEPVLVYADDDDSWVNQIPDIDGERVMLASLETQLLLPLSVKEKLPGFISLGPKQSEEPYSSTDLRLLQSVATQTGLALENSQLTAAIASEVAQRERLNREVEIAREVQERLFPQDCPPVEGLDYGGACRPALGVGGDYYDFLLLPGETFGIAIGDVSGKGISAALLMASLQASLRGQAISGTKDLAQLMSNVNRLVYDASSSNRYATFFYAQYDPTSRALTYVNAGHNPPMIFRQTNDSLEVLRLEAGGVVVGLLPNFLYQQETITLNPGDILVGFTDGISEAMNLSEEEWGEEQLMETVKACEGLTASEMITRLVEAADAFAAGAKQHDDMTLVVVRVV
jgi:sigma-B regulation protein RsbU (phosphoserine phosphatase)